MKKGLRTSHLNEHFNFWSPSFGMMLCRMGSWRLAGWGGRIFLNGSARRRGQPRLNQEAKDNRGDLYLPMYSVDS
ncbi:hypothetical protein GE061_001166 [Apolygus lucorum]|uniref:Uncharacterized protein n=1 Tax=Apolygus lucorum TaxID=248454 RepID=A0A6A4KAL0_APOLU|nr:hypothetical protein GE061_001166 [Apolygus lucorum]